MADAIPPPAPVDGEADKPADAAPAAAEAVAPPAVPGGEGATPAAVAPVEAAAAPLADVPLAVEPDAGAGAGAGAGEPPAAAVATEDAGPEPTVDLAEFWTETTQWIRETMSTQIDCTLSDPETLRTGFGRSTITYKITTYPPGSVVRRRYSDFVWIRDALASRYLGILLPCLPEKKAFGSNNADFVTQRMRALSVFTTRLLNNPFVRKDHTLHDFLAVADPKAWDKVKAAPLFSNDAQNEGLIRWKKCLSVFPLPSDASTILAGAKDNMAQVEVHLRNLVTISGRLASRAQAFMGEVTSFQREFAALTQQDSIKAAPRAVEHIPIPGIDIAATLGHSNSALAQWSKTLYLQPLMINSLIHEALKIELGEVGVLRDLLKQRDVEVGNAVKAHRTLQKHQADLQSLQTQGKASKVDKMQKTVDADLIAAKQAKHVADCFTKGLLYSELDRFSAKKASMLRNMMGEFAATGSAYASRLGKLWVSLLSQLALNPETMVLAAKKHMDSAQAVLQQNEAAAAEGK